MNAKQRRRAIRAWCATEEVSLLVRARLIGITQDQIYFYKLISPRRRYKRRNKLVEAVEEHEQSNRST